MKAVVAGLMMLLAVPGAAQAFDDPKALVEAIYAPYASGGAQADLDQFYSAHLKELFAVHAEGGRVEEASVADDGAAAAPLEFNPFIDAKNALLFDLKVGDPVVLGDAALVTVSFHNFDHPSLLSLALVREGGEWKVDDVTSTGSGAGQNWMLSWLLLYDPWAVH